MNHPEFAVSRFENRNGVISWRVAGWLHGVRIRKNLKTREEAAAEKAVLELKAAQTANGMRTVATTLTEEQVREAEVIFRRMAAQVRPLSFYVDFALANYKEPECQKPLTAAIAAYIAAKEHEFAQDQLSIPQMDRIRWEMKRLKDHFRGHLTVAELTATKLTAFLETTRAGMKTHNNRRGLLSTFFKYCFQRGWIAENPIPRVPHFRIRRKRGVAQTLTVAQARALMEFAETNSGGIWVPYFALCLFAGIRPGVPHGEITKLQPDAVDLVAGVIRLPAAVSKVREPRNIVIQPNLAAWLRAYPLEKFPIIVGNFKKRRDKFAHRLGLTHDVLRHTFISMFVAKFRSIGEAAIQAGNSESIIRKHYLDLKSREEAEQFFGILPRHRASAVPAAVLPIPAQPPAMPIAV